MSISSGVYFAGVFAEFCMDCCRRNIHRCSSSKVRRQNPLVRFQVDSSYEGAVKKGLDSSAMAARKRQLQTGAADEESDIVKRQKLWHHRGVTSTKDNPAPWRPKKQHRQAAKRYLAHCDNQLRQASWHMPGLKWFQLDLGSERWKDWRLCPQLCLAQDMGSEQHTGVQATLYHYDLNVMFIPDGDHGAQRSVWQILQETHLHCFWLLMLVVWNFVDGPDENAYSFRQLQGAVTEIQNTTTPANNFAFQQYAAKMREEFVAAGYEFPGDQSEDVETWQAWVETTKNRRKPERTVTNRFQATIATAQREVRRWTIDLFEREHLCLQLDMLGNKRLIDKIAVGSGDIEPPGETAGPTSGGLQLEDKSIRGCCQNAAAISIVMLQRTLNQRVVLCVLETVQHIKFWRTEMRRLCTSLPSTREWLKTQAMEGVMTHVNFGLGILDSQVALERMHFCFPKSQIEGNGPHARIEDGEVFVDVVVRLVLPTYKRRLVRLLLLIGWPHRMGAAFGGKEWEKATHARLLA